jgi:hypothetical protein
VHTSAACHHGISCRSSTTSRPVQFQWQTAAPSSPQKSTTERTVPGGSSNWLSTTTPITTESVTSTLCRM